MSITKQNYLLESLQQFLADVKLSGQSGGIIYAINEGTEIKAAIGKSDSWNWVYITDRYMQNVSEV